MKIIEAMFNEDNNVVTLQGAFGERFEFNMNEYEVLPKWAEDELKKLHFVSQVGDCMTFQ